MLLIHSEKYMHLMHLIHFEKFTPNLDVEINQHISIDTKYQNTV